MQVDLAHAARGQDREVGQDGLHLLELLVEDVGPHALVLEAELVVQVLAVVWWVVRRSMAVRRVRTWMFPVLPMYSTRLSMMVWPVWSAANRMRGSEWPPSRVRYQVLASFWAKGMWYLSMRIS